MSSTARPADQRHRTRSGPAPGVGTVAVVAPGRMVVGRSDRSSSVRITRPRQVVVRLDEARADELDGGGRGVTHEVEAEVVAGGPTVCVPGGAGAP